jgi:hypothetical protein
MQKYYIKTLENFLSSDKCIELIDFANNHKNKKDTNVGLHPSNCKVKFTDIELSNFLYDKILHSFPEIPEKFSNLDSVWKHKKINKNFKIYSYEKGQHFKKHQDLQSVEGNLISFMRLLVYLNNDFEGGETIFSNFEEKIIPNTGKAALFKMEYWHSGNELLSGEKYMLIADLMFEKQQ